MQKGCIVRLTPSPRRVTGGAAGEFEADASSSQTKRDRIEEVEDAWSNHYDIARTERATCVTLSLECAVRLASLECFGVGSMGVRWDETRIEQR